MIEIKFTLDATPALIGAVRDLAGAIHAAEKAPNLPSGAPADCGRPETPENVEEPKKRKSRAKKAPSESSAPAAPAVDTPAEPEPAPAAEDPAPAEETPAPVEDTPAPVEDTPAPEPAPVVVHLDGDDPLAGKGQTGDVLTELTRKAIAELDAAGVDRTGANRRIRDYCARTDIKYPTFPALLQAVGYSEAMAICKGARV